MNKYLSKRKSVVFISIISFVFRYYLENAARTCQSTITSFLDQTHMIQAMRGRDNYCFALIDTTIEHDELPNDQKQDLVSMYRCIYTAVEELEQELIDDTTKRLLDYEKQSDDMRLKYLFDRIWYTDLCNKMKQISLEFLTDKSKWNDQTKEILSNISRIIKRKEINPSDVNYDFDKRDLIDLIYF
jgi:site-specific DNA-adenine methylase